MSSPLDKLTTVDRTGRWTIGDMRKFVTVVNLAFSPFLTRGQARHNSKFLGPQVNVLTKNDMPWIGGQCPPVVPYDDRVRKMWDKPGSLDIQNVSEKVMLEDRVSKKTRFKDEENLSAFDREPPAIEDLQLFGFFEIVDREPVDHNDLQLFGFFQLDPAKRGL
jgi:hypothetical protein